MITDKRQKQNKQNLEKNMTILESLHTVNMFYSLTLEFIVNKIMNISSSFISLSKKEKTDLLCTIDNKLISPQVAQAMVSFAQNNE